VVARYNTRRQTFHTMTQKIRLWKEIYSALRREFDCGLFVFGSTFNGFGLEESDMDMCLLMQAKKFILCSASLSNLRHTVIRVFYICSVSRSVFVPDSPPPCLLFSPVYRIRTFFGLEK
jgi:DNA polymerase sigma